MGAVVFQFSAEGMHEIVANINAIGKASEQSAGRVRKARATEESADKAAAAKSIATAKQREEARWREVEKTSAKIITAMRRETEAAEREAAKRVKVEKAAQATIAQERNRAIGSMASTGIKYAMGAGGAVLGVVGAAVHQSLRTGELANRLSVNSRQAGETAVNPRILQKEAEAVAGKTPGVKTDDLLRGLTTFVNLTGDLKSARSNASTFATVAQASGADLGDVATTAAAMAQKFGIKTAEEMEDAFASLYQQGKQGAMTLDQVASQMARLSAAGARFGLKGATGLAQLGGLANLARTSTGSAEQASTSTEQMLAHFVQNAPKLLAAGVHVFDQKTHKANDINETIVQTVQKVGGQNMAAKTIQLQHLMGEEGIRGISPMLDTYKSKFQEVGAQGGSNKDAEAAAVSALRDQLYRATMTTETFGGIQRDAAQIQQSASAQLTGAWEKVVAQVGDRLVPAIVPLVGKFEQLVPAMEPIAGALAEFVTGLAGVIKFLEEAHVLAPHSETRAQKAERTEKEATTFEKQLNGATYGPVSPADEAKLGSLKARAAAAKAEADAAGKPMTHEEFAQRFEGDAAKVNILGKTLYRGTLAGVGGQDSAIDRAIALDSDISKDPKGDFSHMGDTPEQKELIQKRQAAAGEKFDAAAASVAALQSQFEATASKMNGLNVADLQANLDTLSKAVAKLAGDLGGARGVPNSDR